MHYWCVYVIIYKFKIYAHFSLVSSCKKKTILVYECVGRDEVRSYDLSHMRF
jgi:hypothetical protein